MMDGNNWRKPDFFIVGAPKCGTTTLYECLKTHPEVFVSEEKEPHYFGSDLAFYRQRAKEKRNLEYYASLFADVDKELRVGEASSRYLSSHRAAHEIKRFNPEARIIIMLRNPVEAMHSWHSQLLYSLNEDIEDFAEALAAEPDRQRGERLPRQHIPGTVLYREMVRFSEQVGRYLEVFGRSRVHIVLHDDLKRDFEATYQKVLRFLEVDETVIPPPTRANANKTCRSRILARLTFWTPPTWLRKSARMLTTVGMRRRLIGSVKQLNTRVVARPELDSELRRRLLHELQPEITALGELIGRDLSHWLEPPEQHASASPLRAEDVAA